MTPDIDRWPEVKRILAQALQLPFEERRKFILQQRLDPELQALALLFVSDSDAALPDTIDSSALPSSAGDPWTGKRVGPYEVRQLIQEGGFGAVYQAVRADNTKKVVAVKFLLPGHDGEKRRELFESEMRILAQMNHPNVVAFVEPGVTPDGRPYYVMEYVEGWNITEYCDKKQMGIGKRLGLFLHVCEAVQYTHENLLVHRDLKPSNIRVTGEGRVKLLDFGVAQSSRPERGGGDPLLTGAVGTVCYASPEQLFGEPTTTVSDIYSLGAILFELLTTKTPFRWQGVQRQDLMNLVRNRTPPLMSAAVDRDAVKHLDAGSLSRLRRSLQGDLDSIVAKALRKEPDGRYASAAALADDIHRHLDGLPVKAHPNTLAYRAKRFVRRNRTPVFAAAVAAIGFAVGVVQPWTRPPAEHAKSQAPGTPAQMTPAEMDRLGDDFHLGRGQLKDDATAVTWYRESADAGLPRGQSDLGVMYLWGWGVERNYTEAYRLFSAAAAKGDPRGENGLGIMSENRLGVERNYDDAMNWYLKAAATGYANAQSNIGGMYQSGHGVKKNYDEAMKWYRKAADQGGAGGQNGIGQLYCYGLGVEKDYTEALSWFHKAVDQDDGLGQSNLGYLYENGWGVPQSDDEALTWYRKSAGQGNASGEYNLALMYERGRGVEKSIPDAIKWLRLSADQGYAFAQAYLGAIYADGADGQHNYVEAAKWFELAAEQDDPVAMDFLGELNEKGWGVTPNLPKALTWYRKAAAMGSEEAKKSLARLGE